MNGFFVTFLLGLIFGWLLIVLFSSGAEKSQLVVEPSVERISLLGGSDLDRKAPNSVSLATFDSVKNALQIVDSASRTELKRWFVSLSRLPRSSPELKNTIIAKLAASDPEDTYKFLESTTSTYDQRRILFTAWAKLDPTAAVDAALGADADGEIYLRAMITGLKRKERNQLYENLSARGLKKLSSYVVSELLASLDTDIRSSVQRVFAFAQNSNVSTSHLMRKVLLKWYETEPDAAFQWANEQTDPDVRLSLLDPMSASDSPHDRESLDRLWDHFDDEQRLNFVSNLRLSDDVDGLLEWIDQKVDSPMLHGRMLEQLLRSLGSSDQPERLPDVIAHLGTISHDTNTSYGIQSTSRQWVGKDPEGFMEWLKTVENPWIKASAEAGLLTHWANEDPMKVIDYWEKNSVTDASSGAYDSILQSLFKNLFIFDPQGDPQTLMDRLPEELHEKALRHGFEIQRERMTPQEAVMFLSNQSPSGVRDDEIHTSLAAWADREPLQAAEWVNTLEDGWRKERAVPSLTKSWASYDLEAAQQWLEDQAPSSFRDKAAEPIISVAASDNPQMAFSLIRELGDEQLQSRLLQETISSIARRDPDSATEELRDAGFSQRLIQQGMVAIEEARALRDAFLVED